MARKFPANHPWLYQGRERIPRYLERVEIWKSCGDRWEYDNFFGRIPSSQPQFSEQPLITILDKAGDVFRRHVDLIGIVVFRSDPLDDVVELQRLHFPFLAFRFDLVAAGLLFVHQVPLLFGEPLHLPVLNRDP